MGGNLEGASKGLPVPSFIEPVSVSITKDEDSMEENKEENKPAPDMNNRDQVRIIPF